MNPEIEKAKQVLRDAGYQVANLWHIDDVKQNYDCTDEEAMEVLEGALKNDATMAQIFDAIDYEVGNMGLTRKED
jgi:muramoyltetrapeptide carboxypeptidase LdcA involved in peptidoglycan recycling